ncbi:MAG: hypothetical protein QOD69_1627 [Solirubrobacteraceae bacterium]|nr:hypothetical protein [Solirubrobacteraceae bacterium]
MVALGVASALAAVPAARADQYVVDHCRHFDADSPFVAFAQVTGADVIDCGGGSGGLNARAPAGQMAAGGALEIGLSIPADRPGIQIERVQSVYAADGPLSGGASLSFSHLGQQIAADAAPVTRSVDALLPPGARSLRGTLTCSAGPCQFQDEFPLFVNRARLYHNESVAPTLTLTGGTLAGAGPKTGRQTLVFDAHDVDSGVSSVTVALGATVVGAVQFSCAFDDWSVCPRDEAGKQLQVDTTKVPDGDQELLVTGRDAAGNALTRSLGTVTIANAPGAGAPNGSNASRAAKLRAAFTTTKARSRRLRFGSRPTVRGTLADEQGRPVAGATIAILQRLRKAGADPVQIATAATNPEGSFSAKLEGGPSRSITFAYRAFAGDSRPAATSVLRANVAAVVSARVSPRSVRVGAPITLAGRLVLLGRAGVEIRIQARQGRTWHTVDTVRTSAGGAFRWRHRFLASQTRRTFTFRAQVTSPIYPFAAGNSRAIAVRVR